METNAPDDSQRPPQIPARRPNRKRLIIGAAAIAIVIIAAIGVSGILGNTSASEDKRVITAPAYSMMLSASDLSSHWKSNGPWFTGVVLHASISNHSSIELYVGDSNDPLGDIMILLCVTPSVDTAKELLAFYINQQNKNTDFEFTKMTDAIGSESYEATLSNPPSSPSYSSYTCVFRQNNVMVVMGFYYDQSYIMTQSWMKEVLEMQLERVKASLPDRA